MTFKSYRIVDIAFLTILGLVSEGISLIFLSDFYITLALLIGIIAIVRWGMIGIIPYLGAIIVRIIFLDLPGADLVDKLLIYGLEFIFYSLAPTYFLFYKKGREKIGKTYLLLAGFVGQVYLLVFGGRICALVLLGENLQRAFSQVGGSILAEAVLVLIITLILAKGTKGLIQDVYYYIRTKEEY